MLTQLTVFETLWYASTVRLPGHFTQEERLARVREVIKRMGLAKVAHTRVGTDMERGLSGGERKRLNVAQELLTDPAVLLADEPTSGLDHVAALSLADVFAELAAAGRTVVATIHQPSSRLFRRFTTCCVLAEGRLVYCGPASAISAYMESPPIERPCPPHYNIADHVLEHVCTVVVASAVWWRLHLGAGAIQDRLGVLTFFVMYVGFITAFSALTTFPAERDVLRRERQSGAYRLSAYYLARCAADIPISCVYPLLVCGTIYWTTGLRGDAGAFFAFLGAVLLVAQVAQALGTLISAAVLDISRAVTLATATMFSFMLTSGLYSTEVPPGFDWIKYIGFTTYGYSITVFIEFPPAASFECGSQDSGFAGLSCPVSGSDVRGAVKPLFDSSTPAIVVLVVMFFVFRVLGYVALRANA
ncbi:hypothetical protein FNF31_06267 [Cafeteria roenbergensis]|uniref:ABC transporter domain-containing protein n=1 Tax=Cafeteria roenbergensis TaxID=33653 RepID=A0A5A8CNJ1_CAFRO|nr:hypothetical protein FNF31_06267 [Cafeteria roenbergensis]